ncbi:hypothetical protein RchiOBHm_Chr7g0209381 [Rosa chinensis]|uniref:Uncharacterized protein n=1 Tax=Rosa chinensis TaxID=74649 RepID=A0A2P6P9Y1_ROSCH|nr:hypothetical protein RchiOBHm_Chr7g0209381 [Rosa chinensis]
MCFRYHPKQSRTILLTPEESECQDCLQFQLNAHQPDSEAYAKFSYKLRETCSDSSCLYGDALGLSAQN